MVCAMTMPVTRRRMIQATAASAVGLTAGRTAFGEDGPSVPDMTVEKFKQMPTRDQLLWGINRLDLKPEEFLLPAGKPLPDGTALQGDALRQEADLYWAENSMLRDSMNLLAYRQGLSNFVHIQLNREMEKLRGKMVEWLGSNADIQALCAKTVADIRCMYTEILAKKRTYDEYIADIRGMYKETCCKSQVCQQSCGGGGGGGSLCGGSGNFWKFLMIAAFIALIVVLVTSTGGAGAASIGLF